MTPAGHVAFAYLAVDARTTDWRAPFIAAFGSLLPDLIDKPLRYLGVFPWGRTIGHSLTVWVMLALLVLLSETTLRPFPHARWLTVGALTHLLADFADDAVEAFQWSSYAFSAWAGWPFTNPDMYAVRVTPISPDFRLFTYFEIAVIALAIIQGVRYRSVNGPVSQGMQVERA